MPSADGGNNGAHDAAGDGHLGPQEGVGAGLGDDAGADLYQLGLKPGQRPVGQRCTAHKIANVLNKFPKSMQPAEKADLRETL